LSFNIICLFFLCTSVVPGCRKKYKCPSIKGNITVNFNESASLEDALNLLESHDFYFHTLSNFKYFMLTSADSAEVEAPHALFAYVESSRASFSAGRDTLYISYGFRNIRKTNLEQWQHFL